MSDVRPPPEATVLPESPNDGITSFRYLHSNKSSSLLASTSWDGSVRVHDTAAKTLQFSHQMDSGPLFSLATLGGAASDSSGGTTNSEDTSLVTGGMDGSIRMVDLQSSTAQTIGQHDSGEDSNVTSSSACSCLASLSPAVVVSAGWHKKVHIWDVRQSSSGAAAAAAVVIDLPGKAFSMDADLRNQRVVVGTSGRRTCFIDIRNAKMELDRESSLKYQIRTVRFSPDGNSIAVGSVEGRVAIEYMEELGLPAAGKKYAFKCHRSGDIVYPVNAIEFHPKFGTFATGGCDGGVVMWDGLHKKKLTSLPKFPTSISALAFNHDGTELAIASSYTFEDGEREHPRDEIYVREMLEAECKPKTSK